MKAYKVFNPDWTCMGFQYEVGKSYEIEREPIMCEYGFHACKNVVDCFNYYAFDPNNKVAEVELSGTILGQDEDKQCAKNIKIIKELTWEQMLVLANTGHGNSGHSNSGHRNSGHSNSGHRNSGDRNSGDRNSGDRNSGDWNSGHWNSGHWNSGDRNSGDRNSGDWNSGYRNSGDWNSGDWNSGFFNTITPTQILIFNKLCDRQKWENAQKPDFINNIILNKWNDWLDMNDEERKQYPNAYVCGGYLKKYGYKEAWQNAYKKATKQDIELLKALPNFDAKIFEEITGIIINE